VLAAGALAVGACSSGAADSRAGAGASARPTTTRAPASTATTAASVDGGSAPTRSARQPATTSLDWSACGPDIECTTLAAPLDHDDPGDGRTVQLALTRRPATDPDRRLGSVLVNPGGPGASGNQYLARFDLPAVAERFDLVSWDPRGVGDSTATGCDGPATARFRQVDSDPDSPTEQADLDAAAEAVADACAASAAELLPHLTTIDTAEDLDLIRAALGDEQLTYVGFSYGTDIGQQYAERFPDRVRAMVLDGVVDPAQDLAALLADQTDGIQRSLDHLFDACEQSASCAVREPRATLDRLAEQLETSPLPAGAGRTLGPAELALATISATYDPSLGRSLLSALAAADGGNGQPLARLADSYTGGASFSAYLSVFCTDSPHPDAEGFRRLAQDLEQRSARIGAAAANELLPCAYWPAPAGGARQRVRAEGAPTILVIGTTGDAATPYDNAEAVARHLADGRLVTYVGEGHTSLGRSRCVQELVADYLVDLAVPPTDATCTD
jgi:pimeloyl-ACP methyl ester carboxylesterase